MRRSRRGATAPASQTSSSSMKRPRHTKRKKAAARSASSSSVSEAMRGDFTNKLRAAAEKARGAGRAWLRAAIARADKLRPYATKTLATFKTLWIAGTNKLRTRFPILDVYARALRLHAAKAVEDLLGRGHRRIGHITATTRHTDAPDRLQGARDALAGAGMDGDALPVATSDAG